VLYRFAGRTGDAIEVLDWPSLQVSSGVAAAVATEIRWRASETALVEPSFRTDPVRTAAALFLAAIGLAVLAAWIAWRLWRPQPADVDAEEQEVVALSPLTRALEAARSASRKGDRGGRRRALERVSRELEAVGLHQLADRASVLAGSAAESVDGDVDDLARRSEAALNGAPG
jgi:hypothetical protein